jgi:phosphoenolpyruvate carboxykinase (ATP)
VVDQFPEDDIDWSQGHLRMDDSDFYLLKNSFLKEINFLKPQTYILERSLAIHDPISVGLRFITTLPSHALFVRHLFSEEENSSHLDFLTIYHYPLGISDWEELGHTPQKITALHFNKREIIIAGSTCFDDIRSAILIFMSFILIKKNILPLHAEALLDSLGHGYLFFDNSITKGSEILFKGSEELIFEEQISLSNHGVSSPIPGKYLQDERLKSFIPTFGSICNNFDPDQGNHSVLIPAEGDDYNRGLVWPSSNNLSSHFLIKEVDKLFIFIKDDYGVLPLISKLTSRQAHFYFMNGYMGNNTFKSCCGDPYRLVGLKHYGRLFFNFLERTQTSVWLVNKGCYGGKVNQGTDYPSDLIRHCVTRIMQTEDHLHFYKLPLFELSIPLDLAGVERRFLNPLHLWEHQEEYFQSATQFEKLMRHNFDRLGLAEEVHPSPQIGELNI